MMIDDVRVMIENGTFSAEDVKYYVDALKHSLTKFTLKKVTLSRTENFVDLRYAFKEIPFERIRRVSLSSLPASRAASN
jgi:hypothetical protein